MKNHSTILELAALITRHTTTVNNHLQANGLPQPSFEIDGPTDLKMKSAHAEDARLAAIGAAIELTDLLQGPVACLRPAVHVDGLQRHVTY